MVSQEARIMELREQVVRLNRILANEGVMDAFGHASVRDVERPDRFFLPRARAPELITIDDVVEFDLEANPVMEVKHPLYSERVIHGALYRHRPDVGAVCHHHSPAVLPFCLTDRVLLPTTQLAASMGASVPVWDSRKRFGATNHLVTTLEQAADLAEALGQSRMVLMRRHGATHVGRDARDLAFLTINSCRGAEALYQALLLGPAETLTPEEVALAENYPASSIARSWELWTKRLSG